MNYTLNQLQVFVKVAEMESVTLAAEALSLTQPAVSIQLRNFQDQFDLPLSEIVGRRIYITDFGREIAIVAQEILNQVNALDQKTLAYKGLLVGKLRITVVSTGKYVMPYFLAKFMDLHPGIELVIDVTNKETVVQHLINNEVDFGLVSILPDSIPLNELVLMDNELHLVGNQNTKLFTSKQGKQFLEKASMIFREKGSGTRQVMEQFLSNQKLNILKKMEMTSNEAVKQAVIAGLGLSIMPIIGIRNELELGQLKVLPFKGLPIMTKWRLVWREGKQLSPVAFAYLEFLNQNLDLIETSFFRK